MEIESMQTTPSTQIVKIPTAYGELEIGGPAFSVIAGPCSIESHGQFLETAQMVKENGACMLRGGIWKMRTSAKTFQGLGDTSFDFIRSVCKQTRMGLVSEVTQPASNIGIARAAAASSLRFMTSPRADQPVAFL